MATIIPAITVGNLLYTMSFRTVVGFVSAETTVDAYLLFEDNDFLEMVRTVDTIAEAIEWANENY